MRYATSLIGWALETKLYIILYLHVLLTHIYISRGPSTLATFVAVYALFGPTFPGIYDKDRGVYTLFYPVCTCGTLLS